MNFRDEENLTRTEHDLIGERELPKDAFWGIHTLRAQENFAVSGYRLHPELIRAIAQIKKACAQVNIEMGYLSKSMGEAIVLACEDIIEGRLHEQFLVDVFQGGAGTSTNMNANEVIANRAIEILGGEKGDYSLIHPNDHVNLHQSTNDVIPTAIRIAMITLFRNLPFAVSELEEELKKKGQLFANILKMGRTQHQDAVPLMLGSEFTAYAEVIRRDKVRFLECEKVLSGVNMGGTSIGTGIAAPRKFGQMVIKKINSNMGFGLFQANNLIDATQNLDAFAFVSGMLKIHAANLSKITSDLMMLHAGPRAGIAEIKLPEVQAGSSIMPGKVNPVIAEMMEQVAMKVIANDYVVCEVIRRGRLELNAFLPLLSYCLFESISMLEKADHIFAEKCVSGIQANEEACREQIESAWKNWGLTALVTHIGYARATEIAIKAKQQEKTPREIILAEGIFSEEELDKILFENIGV